MHPGCLVELPEQIEHEAEFDQAARILGVTFMGQLQSPPGFLEAKDIFGPVRFRGLCIGAQLQAPVHFGREIVR